MFAGGGGTGMGAEPKVSYMLGRFSTTELHADRLKNVKKYYMFICTYLYTRSTAHE